MPRCSKPAIPRSAEPAMPRYTEGTTGSFIRGEGDKTLNSQSSQNDMKCVVMVRSGDVVKEVKEQGKAPCIEWLSSATSNYLQIDADYRTCLPIYLFRQSLPFLEPQRPVPL